ncbi:MAG: hypothetical protein FWD81_03825 [Methanomassiliicoccaceae archaeon]|nr:hypothetical protein [Methanomassiliicoccaceae archaeon]
MLEPEDIKIALRNGSLMQDDLFACGEKSGGKIMSFLQLAAGVPNISLFGFTILDDELVITPTDTKSVLINNAVFIKREDVKKLDFRIDTFGDGVLTINYNNGKSKLYRFAKPFDEIKKIIDRFNS